MWVILNNSFVSIVEHRDKPDVLIVRARFAGDIERFMRWPLNKSGAVLCTPDADYRFRAYLARKDVQRAMVLAVAGVRYPNFKDSIKAAFRKALAMRVWSIFHAAQQERAGQ
jgi:hypothetical protein